VRAVVLSFIICTIYWNADITQQGVFSINGALQFISLQVVFTFAIGQSLVFPTQVPAVKREAHANMYSTAAWLLSKMLVDIPYDVLPCLILSTSIYWTIIPGHTFQGYLMFSFLLWVINIWSTAFGQFVGSISPHPLASLPLCLTFLFPMFLYGGLVMNLARTAPWMVWLKYSSIFFYGFRLFAVNVWDEVGEIECTAPEQVSLYGCQFRTSSDILAYFGCGEKDDFLHDMIILIMYVLALRVVTFVMLSRRVSMQMGPSSVPAGSDKEVGPPGPAGEAAELPHKLKM